MRLALACLFAFPLLVACDDARAPLADPVQHADPLVGSGGGGFAQPQVFVGATTPFGLVRLGPDTEGELPRDVGGFAHTSGYWYVDRFIQGFSHLHLSGTGVEDFGTLLVMPTLGMSSDKTDEGGYRQEFSHDDEEASPGRYAVTFAGSGISAELTATSHAGLHRYRFPTSDERPTLIFDVGHGIGRPGALDATVSWADGCAEGSLDNAGRFTGEDRAFPIYFSACVDVEPAEVGTFEAGTLTPGATSANGPDVGMYLELPVGTEEVRVYAGISLIDAQQARDNRAQVDGRAFEEVHEETEKAWRARLASVAVRSDDVAKTRTFFSALYHAALMPTLYSESGRYRGVDRELHDDDGVPYYSDLSMWDTYRTAHPLYALLWPRDAEAFATSIVRMAEQHGSLPRWPLAVNETGVMLGTPASIILADTWLRGARGFDIDAALDWMRADADSVEGRHSREGHAACLARGFCSRDDAGRGVASAIEWGFADFALAQLLSARGDEAAAEKYREQATLVRGHFDGETGFLRGREADGSFDPADSFDATEFLPDYAEGNAWQYFFAAPYDTAGLAELLGGPTQLVDKAREMFELTAETPPRYLAGEIRQPDPYYWHGNEPDLHAAIMFALAGAPDETARWMEWLRNERHDDTPWGLEGNDDGGTLSAWYVLAAIGLFPLPGSDVWVLVPPAFDDIVINRVEGGPLHVVTERASADAVYVERVLVDGEEHDRAWLSHDVLAEAVELRFVLVDEPTGFAEGLTWPADG
jgi:predicted alpha-1,2-mannosidase